MNNLDRINSIIPQVRFEVSMCLPLYDTNYRLNEYSLLTHKWIMSDELKFICIDCNRNASFAEVLGILEGDCEKFKIFCNTIKNVLVEERKNRLLSEYNILKKQLTLWQSVRFTFFILKLKIKKLWYNMFHGKNI